MSISIFSAAFASIFAAYKVTDNSWSAQPIAGKHSQNVDGFARKPRVLDCNNPFEKSGPPCRAMPPLWRDSKPPRTLDRVNPFYDNPPRPLDTENPYV
ncbi:MAG TPA: hypothetical protein VFW62_10260 [bacterium]|nr:hypothetical protein [bacterium]